MGSAHGSTNNHYAKEDRIYHLIMARRAMAAVLLLLSLHSLAAAQAPTSPQFLSQPTNVTAALASTVNLACSASGSPTITWYKDRQPLSLDSRRQRQSDGSLRITNLLNSDGGQYYCLASDSAAGSVASLTATLQIAYLSSPSNTALQQRSVVDTESLVLPCEIPDSVPRPQVMWPDLSSQQRANGRVTFSQNGTLVFSPWDRDTDVGLYRCQVTNPITGPGEPVESSRYFLQENTQGSPMLYRATEFVIRPSTIVEAVVGDTAIFECFTTGIPTATISWTKDSQSLTISGRISTPQSGRVLTITGVTTSDAGSYTCITQQSAAMGTTHSIQATGQLNVIVPPRITSGLQRTNANLDQPISLTCRAEGTPPLQWAWLKDGVVLQQSQGGVAYTTSGAESMLTISSVRESDGGVYQCVATQPATGRQAASNNYLHPIAIPPVLTHGDLLRDQLVLSGSTVVFPCTASGAPTPTYTWTKAGLSQPININADSRYTLGPGDGNLTISPAMVADSSTLTCTATNSAGSVSATAQLRVILPPTGQVTPSGQRVITPGESLTLDCAVTHTDTDVTIAYRWRRDGLPYRSNVQSITLTTGTGDINGLYECLVLLSAGDIHQAEPVQWNVGQAVVTVGDPPVPPSAPTNPLAGAITATSFIASWIAPSFTGRLALRNYTIETRRETRRDGSEICLGDSDYVTALEGISSVTTTETVPSLHPYSTYTFRVIVFNSVYRSDPSVASAQFQTPQAVPQAPPSSLEVAVGGNEGELLVNWSPIGSCADYGGPITGYVIQYKTANEVTFTEQEVGVVRTSKLTGLQLSTMYQVKVAARTSVGVGPFTVVMETRTADSSSPPPEPPAQLTGAVINSTSVELMWVAPSNQGPNEITGYTLSYKTSIGQIITVDENLGVEQRTYEVVDLEAGMTYTFRVAALNMFGAGPLANLTLTLPGKEVDKPFYEEVWFFGIAAVGGALIIAIVIATCCICICCCCKCAKKDGKYYITSRRTTSSMSSNGFSEYHNKSRSQTQMIQIHSSPTPSRRSTDYADIGPGRFPQTNSGYPNPQTMMMNGHVGHHTAGNAFPHDQHISHDSHMGMHQGQFNPNEQGYPHDNVPNMTHQFTRGKGQDYPDGGVAQSHQVRGQFDQSYPPDSHANLRDQFRHNQQEYPPQDMHRDQFNPNINEQEYPLQDMHRDQFNPININEQEYPLQDMHNMRGMSYQLQDNASSGQMSNRFVDTLTRVHTPPNPHNEYPDSIDYPAPSSRNSQSTEESWNPSENLNFRGHMTNNPVSRSSSFMSTVSTNSFERGPLPPNISPKANDHRGRGHTALSPLPENQFFEQGHHNGSSMQDLQHLHPPRNRSRSMGQRMNRVGNQEFRNRAHSFEGMLDMESNQQRMEHGESNLDIQQRALPPLPTAGMESGHITSLSPVPNPHSIEYTMDPEVQMSHSQSVPPVQGRKAMQYPGQNSQQPPRSYQQHENQARSHGYPSQPAHVTNHPPPPQGQHHLTSAVATTAQQKLTHHQHPLHQKQQQMSLPPPPPFIGKEQPTHPPASSVGGQNIRGHHSKNQKPQQHPLSLQQQHHPGVVQSMTQLQHLGKVGGGASHYKPEISDHHQHHHHHQRQQSLPDEQQGGSMLLPAHQQQNFNHGGGALMNPSNAIAVAPQHARSVNQSTPNLAFSPAVANVQQQQPGMMNGVRNSSEATPTGFRRIPMTGGHTHTQYNDEISQDTVEAWDQIDQIQRQNFIQLDLDMQNMLTPRVTDEMERGRDQFLFQNDTLNLDDSLNSTSSFLSHTHSTVSPITAAGNMKPPNGFPMTSSMTSSSQAPPPVQTKPPKVAPKMTPNKSTQQNLMNSFDSDSQLQIHKRRPSYPENDPKKPQLKKGKYPKAVWVQKSMNRAIESSSDSESDSDMSMDTVIAGPASAGDTESLKSSHV